MLSDGTGGGTPERDQAAPDWRAWMHRLGQTLRKAREATGLSQSGLAAVAGVSQGAISRLETGRGLGTPLLVVLKTARALRDAGRGLDPQAMPHGTALLVESLARLAASHGLDPSADQG